MKQFSRNGSESRGNPRMVQQLYSPSPVSPAPSFSSQRSVSGSDTAHQYYSPSQFAAARTQSLLQENGAHEEYLSESHVTASRGAAGAQEAPKVSQQAQPMGPQQPALQAPQQQPPQQQSQPQPQQPQPQPPSKPPSKASEKKEFLSYV